jgi:peptide/nickel transport system substrate-binding protein
LFSDSDGGNDGVPDFYDPQYDVTFHGFSITAVTQGTATAQFQSDGGNNEWGYQNAKVDILSDQLQSDVLTAAQVTAKRIAIDKIVHDSYWGLPLYQNPTLTAYNSAVANVKPQPIGYDVVWNYWEWHF